MDTTPLFWECEAMSGGEPFVRAQCRQALLVLVVRPANLVVVPGVFELL